MGRLANRRRPNLTGPSGVAVIIAVLCLALPAGSALAARGHFHLVESMQHKKRGGKTTAGPANGKNADEEVIIIGHTKSGKREEVVISGPKGAVGHVSATDGPGGGIGHVTVTGRSSDR